MRIRSRITFWSEDVQKAARILNPLGFKANTKPNVNTHSATLFTDQPEYRELLKELEDYSIQPSETREMWFEEVELENARLLAMHPEGYWGYPQPEDGFKLESYDTSSACPVCGRGVKQVRPFLISGRPRLGRNDILAMNWTFEFIVTERLKDLIEQAELTGAEFWPLLNRKDRSEMNSYFQLFFRHELPPMSIDTDFEVIELSTGEAPRCSHPILNLRLHQMKYSREVISSAEDFNKTWEWLGGGWFGQTQWMVVSHRVFSLFRRNNIKKVKFQPVLIENG